MSDLTYEELLRLDRDQLLERNVLLVEAQNWLRHQLDEGAKCPCCTQFAKVYKRKINASMARSLIVMWRAAQLEFQHIPTTVGARSREEGKLAAWKLIEEEARVRDDGGRAGYWRVTDLGYQFAHGFVTIPKYAKFYDGRVMGFEGDRVTVRDALGDRFDYDELMNA